MKHFLRSVANVGAVVLINKCALYMSNGSKFRHLVETCKEMFTLNIAIIILV